MKSLFLLLISNPVDLETPSASKICVNSSPIPEVCPSYVETSFNKGKDLPMMSVQYLALVVDRIVNDFYKFGIKTLEIVVEKVK